MHIVLAFLGSVITILILVNRLSETGISLDSLNPFAWYRKHKWLKKYHTRPIYNIKNSLDSAALYVVAVANADGMISLEEKKLILEIFEKEFELSDQEASGLFTASAFFLKEGDDVVQYMPQILKLSKGQYTQNQIDFTLECMKKVAALSIENSSRKNLIIEKFEKQLAQ